MKFGGNYSVQIVWERELGKTATKILLTILSLNLSIQAFYKFNVPTEDQTD